MAHLDDRRALLATWGKRSLATGAMLLAAVLAFVLIVVVAVGAYTRAQVSPTPEAALSYIGFLDDLQTHGATVQEDGQGGPGQALPSTAHIVIVNGSKVTVYEYATTHDAKLDVARISPDGSTITNTDASGTGSSTVIDYIAPPHWFYEGRVLVLYVGCDDTLIALLQQVLGPPFAGDDGQSGC